MAAGIYNLTDVNFSFVKPYGPRMKCGYIRNKDVFEYLEKLVTNVCEIHSLNDLKEAFDKDYISHFGKTILKWNK